jgi:anthranilate phosphoribosyltransferase
MSITAYLREIGRGRHHAKNLTHEQAQDLMGQILDGQVSDVALGAFCAAMRVKGETAQELAGFVHAARARMHSLRSDGPTVVIPSYTGARRLPLLTPLLAGLLARQGVAVLIHGTPTEHSRVACDAVMHALGWPIWTAPHTLRTGEVVLAPTALLHPGLQRLLELRFAIGLRNSGHSLVKMLNPLAQGGLLISSYTHPEYAHTMADAFAQTGTDAVLLRGTEGEAVADPRRQPLIEAVLHQQRLTLAEAQTGPLAQIPALPDQIDPASTARFIRDCLEGVAPVPAPIQTQVACVMQAMQKLSKG